MRRYAPWVMLLGVLLIAFDPLASGAMNRANAQTFITPRGEAQNVRFDQGDNGIITIVYDLISPEPRAVFTVKLEASMDMGGTFNMPMQTISGDVGTDVSPGAGKRIVWEAAKDVERVQIDRLRFRIVATGGPLAIETPTLTARDIVPAPVPAPSEPEPKPVVASPVARPIPPAAKKGGSKAKWLIPLVAVGGAGGALAARGSGSGAAPSTTTTTTTTTTATTPPTTPPTTAPVQCQYSVSPLSFSFIATASTSAQGVTVSTTSTCTWTATSNASFVSISGSTSFVGSGSFVFALQANTTTSARTGALTVAGQTVTITQEAPQPDSLSLISVTPAAGSTITAGPASSGGIAATVRYVLVSKPRAFICVQPIVAIAPTVNRTECGPVEVSQGIGTVVVRSSIQASAPDLPFTTTQLSLFMGDNSQFTTGNFYRTTTSAIFNWRRPGAP